MPEAKLKWIKNVMRFKITIKVLKTLPSFSKILLKIDRLDIVL